MCERKSLDHHGLNGRSFPCLRVMILARCVQYDKLPRRYQYLEEIEHTRLTDAVEIIFYELPKLEQRVQEVLKEKIEIQSLREDEKWCIFMRYHHEERTAEIMEKLCQEEAGIMHAEKTVNRVSRDYERYARKMAIMKNSMDRASEIYDARLESKAEGKAEGLAEGLAEGIAKGIDEGIAKNNLAIARKMKAMGDSDERINVITGLPVNTIKSL